MLQLRPDARRTRRQRKKPQPLILPVFWKKDADISEDFKKTLHAYAKTTFKDGYTLYKKACKSEEYVQAAAASKIQGRRHRHYYAEKRRPNAGQQTFSVPQPLTLRLWLKFCRHHPVCGK